MDTPGYLSRTTPEIARLDVRTRRRATYDVLMRRLVLCLLLTLMLPTEIALADSHPLRTGFYDPVHTAGKPDAGVWFDRAKQVGSDIVRVRASWRAIAPSRPASPADPADPAYRWEDVDNAVRAATGAGLDVAIGLVRAPQWAEGANRPADAPAGTWRPDSGAYREFARALARRYSGRFGALPAVRYFQPWNEPNLGRYLTPQWERRGGRDVIASPEVYRDLHNAFYSGVKAENPAARVVAAGTSPFGDPEPGGDRIRPLTFVRALLCLDARLRRTTCSGPMRTDAFDHHPYSVRGPFAPAYDDDDATVADLYKIQRVLRAAERQRTTAPAGRKELWVTELGWDSAPGDPSGLTAETHAAWLQQTLFQLWNQGVTTVMWFLIGDAPPVPSLEETYQTGVFLADGRPKLSRRAFEFPFVALRTGSKVRIWGLAPRAGVVVVERRAGRRWVRVARVRLRRHHTFDKRLSLPRTGTYRARIGSMRSLSSKPLPPM